MKIVKLLSVIVCVVVFYAVVVPQFYKTCSSGLQVTAYRIFESYLNFALVIPLITLGSFAIIFRKTDYRKIYWSVIVTVSLLIVLIVLVLASPNPVQVQSTDARRISDLRQLQNALELYASEHNNEYPQKLEDVLTVRGIAGIPKDPVTNENYGYAPSPDKKSYVLRAMFNDNCFSKVDRQSLSFLKDSPKGVINGLQCDSPAYCIVYRP